jgi:hypothetical protein
VLEQNNRIQAKELGRVATDADVEAKHRELTNEVKEMKRIYR